MRRLSSRFYLAALISFLFFLDVFVLGFVIVTDRDRTIERAKIILQKTALSLNERMKRTTTATDVILHNLAERIREKGIGRIKASKEDWEVFRRAARSLPEAGSIWLLDDKGELLMDSTMYPSRRMNFADREYFVPQRDQGIESYIGPLVKGRITEKYSFTISRRISGKDGRFLGIVLAAVETDDFTNFLRNLDIGEEGRVTVFRTDGALVLRQPMQGDLLGRNFKDLVLFKLATGASPSGTFESPGLEGAKRLIAYSKIEDLPLIVTTGIPVDLVLREWRSRAKYYTLTAVVALFLLAWVSRQAYKSVAREERTLTELVSAKDEISRINEDLDLRVKERTRQLEDTVQELERFSYSVSHDLKAPLRAIDGFSRMLLSKYGDSMAEDAQRHIKVIRESTQTMGNLIEDLLSFSRYSRRRMDVDVIDMKALAHNVWQGIRETCPQREIECDIGELPPGRGDSALIRQVVFNLLSNAAKFTKDKNPAVIAFSGHRDGGEIVYAVRDNGVGFDMAYCDKLFSVFERLHSDEYEGTGVGLAIVQRIVHRHGGRVWAEGKEGEGAAFYFTLPDTDADHSEKT